MSKGHEGHAAAGNAVRRSRDSIADIWTSEPGSKARGSGRNASMNFQGELHRAAADAFVQISAGFGLVRDLQDCWLFANESYVSLMILHQAALGLRHEETRSVIERLQQQNKRQRCWFFTKIAEASPQALTVPM